MVEVRCRYAPATLAIALAVGACSSSSAKPVDAGPVDSGADTAVEDAPADVAFEAAEAAAPEGGVCPLVGVTLIGPQTPNLTGECTACLGATCCSEAVACSKNTDCAALTKCLAACPSLDSPCAAACDAAHTSGQTAGGALLGCVLARCDVSCQSYSCIGSVTWPAPKSPTVTFTFTPVDFSTSKPIVGATVKVCAASDPACANPSATYTTDANGSATVTAPSSAAGIAGYLEVSAASSVTTLEFLASPTGNASLSAPGAVVGGAVLSTTAWAALAKAAAVTPDPTRGYLAFIADDCAGYAASGVSVAVSTADASTKTAYLKAGLPSTAVTSTDATGEGAVVNVPPGPATLTATDFGGAKFSSEPLVFRAGAITATIAVATP